MKYIIDIPDEYENDYISMSPLLGKEFCYPLRNMNKTYVIPTGLKIEPYTEPSQKAINLQHAHDIENVARMNYRKGAEDAWELARRIICPPDCCEDSISKYTEKFLGIPSHKARAIFKDLSYQEVKAKYQEWKKQKDEIRVGDEVEYVEDHRKKIVVTSTYSDGWFDAIDSNGYLYIKRNPVMWKKTGRHFDGVEELLKKMWEKK